MVDDLLKLDEQMVDGVLASGHNWAEDHISTSKDDVEEVYNFLMTKQVAGPVGMDEKKSFPDLTGDGKVTYADVLKGRGVKLKKTDEGLGKTLATAALGAAMAFGSPSSAKADTPKDSTATTQTVASKEFKGEGVSSDLALAKKMAIGDAQRNAGSRGTYKVTDEKASKTSDGDYKYEVTIKVVN